MYKKILLYIAFGSVAFLVDNLTFNLLLLVYKNYLFTNIISVHAGIIVSFFLNVKFNFKIDDKIKNRFSKFYLISILGLILSSSLLFLFIDILHSRVFIAKILTSVLTAITQYILNIKFSFKHKSDIS